MGTSERGKRSPGHLETSKRVMQTMLSHLVVISLMIMATSASVVMTRVERVSRLEPVPAILILHNVARQEQAGHTAGHQTAPVRLLRQLSDVLLSTIFASKSSYEQQQPCGRCQRELADQSGHRRTQR